MKKLLPCSLLVILLFSLALSGCGRSSGRNSGGNHSGNNGGSTPVVYVGGTYHNNTTGVYTACYWDGDGTRHDLGDGSSDSKVYWLSFYNDELYAVGYYKSGDGDKEVPCYWNNTGRHDLLFDSDSIGNNAGVTCGYVYNDQVYAGGWYKDETETKEIPCYWDQEGQYDLATSDSSTGRVSSIFVNDDGVYVVGAGSLWACCWYNGEELVKLDGGVVTHILVDNDRIYMGGSSGYDQKACYWVKTGGDPTQYEFEDPTPAEVSSIFVQDNQVYAGGYYTPGKRIACYWDGGGRHDLASDESEVKSIVVYGKQVYTAGFVGKPDAKNACYWIGTQKQDLDDGGSSMSEATCILVR